MSRGNGAGPPKEDGSLPAGKEESQKGEGMKTARKIGKGAQWRVTVQKCS